MTVTNTTFHFHNFFIFFMAELWKIVVVILIELSLIGQNICPKTDQWMTIPVILYLVYEKELHFG